MELIVIAILHTVTLLSVNAVYISSTEEPLSGPQLPTEYYFKGDIMDVVNGIVEPFEIWYSPKLNRSRFDVFGGTVKKYYWADVNKLVTYHPEADDSENAEVTCNYVRSKKKPFNILPTELEWTLTGTGTFNGEATQIWEAFGPANITTAKRTLVTRRVGEVDVPVSMDAVQYKVSSGTTLAHTYTIYSSYNATVDNATLTIDEDKFDNDCNFNPYGSIESRLQHLRPYISTDVELAYDRYKEHHKKIYSASESEHEMRRDIFEYNWRRVTSHNRKNLGYKLELNQFADWTEDELVSLTGALPSKEVDLGTHPFPHALEDIDILVEEMPEEYDLRMEGFLTPIKNQQECGSCWAFATTATVEAALIKQNGGQMDLSEQSLVDCGWPYSLMGCNGGFLGSAFKYVKENGIPTEAEYGGYMHEDGFCHIKNMSDIRHIKGYTRVTPHSINALKYAVYTYGAVEVSIHASDTLFLYSSGVIYDMSCEGQHMNHAVVVVGYGTRDTEPYWIVRNSWGETWGEDGYVLMSARDNNCLILDEPYYPVV